MENPDFFYMFDGTFKWWLIYTKLLPVDSFIIKTLYFKIYKTNYKSTDFGMMTFFRLIAVEKLNKLKRLYTVQ